MECILESSVKGVHSVYDAEPDFRRPPLDIDPQARAQLLRRLSFLYGEEKACVTLPELERIMKVHIAHKPEELRAKDLNVSPGERFSEQDIILITYGDLLRGEESSPLGTLATFCDTYLHGTINTLHILPFFPSSSDRGFSVMDFEAVDPHLGSWQDIDALENRYRLMFDGVFNHVSSRSRWFREFLGGNEHYRDFFIAYEGPEDLTPEQHRMIFRPRTSNILTEYHSMHGPVRVWTTFSPDQIDLNYRNPRVLLRVIEILLLYVRHGADIIRLDAVSYLWREPGTRCVNLAQTHEIVKLLRNVLDIVAPAVTIITETNVPHDENISYFGKGDDEAQMVYNFALPPLVLHALYAEDSTALTRWAQGLAEISPAATYFNFLDSHDGIGLMGATGILDRSEIDFVVARAQEHGARVSYRSGPDGNDEPYEINTTWFSALNHEEDGEDISFKVKRFVASRIIALVLRGVPGVYLHGLIGTLNDIQAVLATHSNRDINRRVIDAHAVYEALQDPLSKISRINRELGRLIDIRTRQRAFHPNGGQRVLSLSPDVFAVLRTAPGGGQKLLTVTNVTSRVCHVSVPIALLDTEAVCWHDLVSDVEWMAEDGFLFLSLAPYDVVWLETPAEKDILRQQS